MPPGNLQLAHIVFVDLVEGRILRTPHIAAVEAPFAVPGADLRPDVNEERENERYGRGRCVGDVGFGAAPSVWLSIVYSMYGMNISSQL